MRTCPKCKAQGRDGSRICKHCGSILVDGAAAGAPDSSDAADIPVEVDPGEIELPRELPSGGWLCVKCGEHHARNVIVCWNCGTDARGREDPGFVKEETEDTGAGRRPRSEPESVLHPEEVPYRAVAQCERCRSRKVIPDLALELRVNANPDAVFYTGTTTGWFLADICGECGHVELKLKDAAKFYRTHLAILEKKREARR